MSKTRSYQDDLLKALTDPVEAREYLNAALTHNMTSGATPRRRKTQGNAHQDGEMEK